MRVRELYYNLLNSDERYAEIDVARKWLDGTLTLAESQMAPAALGLAAVGARDLQNWLPSAWGWRSALGERTQARLGSVSTGTMRQLLAHCAPMAVVTGCLLQFVSSAASSHLEAVSLLVRTYMRLSGNGDGSRHFGNAYQDLLRVAGSHVTAAPPWSLARDSRIADAMFTAPAFQLALSLFPLTYMPELLGANLFNAVLGTHPIVQALEPALAGVAGQSRYFAMATPEALQHQSAAEAIAAIEAYFENGADEFVGLPAPDWDRVCRGFSAAYLLHVQELEELHTLVEAGRFTASEQMIELIRRKAPFALGYHKRRSLGGRTLDTWFEAGAFDGRAMLDALARSPYVRPGDPDRSLLLTTATSARGPMSGIFNRDELDVVSDWIRGLPQTAGTGTAPAHPAATLAAPAIAAAAPETGRSEAASQSDREYAQLSTRELYFRLLHNERFPEAQSYARKFAALWLSRAGQGLDKGLRAIPFAHYNHAALENWLLEEHSRQVNSYGDEPEQPLPSRQDMIDSSVQLCPMVYIDGAWLQRMTNVAICGTAVGTMLFRIYLDEVGNGSAQENHPNVYRELMAEMGVQMPPFGSMEFCMWDGFKDSAFLVPAFWLSVSQSPRHFMPEILGLNLAMELSGVGGAYRSSSDALRHYGFTPAFVDLHNTVDNASTGHSAIALEAIKVHMDEILERGGAEEVQRRWRRVWTGYRALTPPAGFA